MIRHVLSVKLIFFDFPSDIGPTFCGMGVVRTENVSEINNLVVSAEKALSYENFDNFVSN